MKIGTLESGEKILNKKTIALTEEQYKNIIFTMRTGFTCPDGHVVKGNTRIATALSLEANLGLRISDILQLRLSAIIRDGDRYRLDIVEQKTKKKREFTVPVDIYVCIQNYALENNINPAAKLFDMGERAITKHLKLVCDHLGYNGIGSHSFRKYFATSIYVNNNYDINLVRVLLQHSSTVTTQRYIGIQNKNIEDALQNHIKFFD